MSDFFIHSTRCFLNGSFKEATLYIKGNRIERIFEGEKRLDSVTFTSYGNKIMMPGIIDAHVHINEPGRTLWEGFDSATKAAAVGGITTLIEMPLNASPVTSTLPAFKQKKVATKGKLHVNCGFYGGIVPHNTEDIEDLLRFGAFGIKGFLSHSGIDEFPKVDKKVLSTIAPILKKYDVPLLLHCELEDTDVPEVVDTKSYQEYLASRPQRWEQNAIDLAIEVQKEFDIKVHVVHLSASDAIDKLIQRKLETRKLTVETCPHYVYFNAEEIPDASPIYKCAPPIRGKENNLLLLKGIQTGLIDFIGSDHSPAPPDVKQLESGDFFKAWGGISGLQFSLPVMNTKCFKEAIALEKLIPLLTENPAKFLGLENKKGFLKEGFDADIVVWDDNEIFELKEELIQHRHKPTPYLNHKLKGVVKATFVNGNLVFSESEIIATNKGELLERNNKKPYNHN
ncbi:allantoinase AllB [Cellulophaga baltica]|uniref:allantoinase AllB n=1 Tax=Cellulophaga TaxID=104264 RepID=UPI001C066BA5|nr:MULTISPECIES: allantoinase AllB [Cellulophaga]MBU2996625.1 allantoinase AllB [Cellulophaga baltica]MDO6768019.1 allantoinase AllB [Cellulophaga sp. 1_MG-2023]